MPPPPRTGSIYKILSKRKRVSQERGSIPGKLKYRNRLLLPRAVRSARDGLIGVRSSFRIGYNFNKLINRAIYDGAGAANEASDEDGPD